jgi:hypothetical protein
MLDSIIEELETEFEGVKRQAQQAKAQGIEPPAMPPHIIVVDEHSLWKNSSTGGKDLLKFEEKVIYEGRKYEWYLHVTSKSPLAQDFGSSAVRDNFVTSLIYKVRKKQARTYFQDSDLVELVKQCDKPGMAVYTDKNENSEIVRVPKTTAADMATVFRMVSNGAPVAVTTVANVTDVTTGAKHVNADVTGVLSVTGNAGNLQKRIESYMKRNGLTLSKFAEDVGINKGLVSRYLRKGQASDETLQALQTYLNEHDTNNVIDLSKAREEKGKE